MNPGRLATEVSYNPALKRYIMTQFFRVKRRVSRAVLVSTTPEPWGPWTTVFFAPLWDVGPGESSSLPTKWMSDDGKTMYLVFRARISSQCAASILSSIFRKRNRRSEAKPQTKLNVAWSSDRR